MDSVIGLNSLYNKTGYLVYCQNIMIMSQSISDLKVRMSMIIKQCSQNSIQQLYYNGKLSKRGGKSAFTIKRIHLETFEILSGLRANDNSFSDKMHFQCS